jgi:hypothetical protein
VGLLDALLGRSKPVRPNLDRLFAIPSAAVTLQSGADLAPTGLGSVCFATVEGGAFKQLQRDVRELLDADRERGGVPVEFSQDEYGYTWLLARHPPDDVPSLVNDLHAVNTLLSEGGFGPQLLCSLVGFRSVGAPGTGSREGASEGAEQPAPSSGGARTPGGGRMPGYRSLALVYLYKRGTFYPFAPVPGAGERRDNELELQVRGMLTDDLPVETDLSRWFPVWGTPGL